MEQRSWPDAGAEPPAIDWRRALSDLERNLREAVDAIGALRLAFEQGLAAAAPGAQEAPPEAAPKPELTLLPNKDEAPETEGEAEAEDAEAAAKPELTLLPTTEPEPAAAEEAAAPEPEAEPAGAHEAEAEGAEANPNQAAFERVWERLQHEKLERTSDGAPSEAPAKPASPRGLALLPQTYLMTVEDRESRVDLVPLHRSLLSLVKMENISLVSFANATPVISVKVAGELDMEQLRDAVANGMDRECEVIEQGNNRLFLRLSPRQDPRD